MNKSNFLACCAKSIFVFSAVMMASVALTSCSKDEQEEQPTKENFVVLDGAKKTIHSGEYEIWDCYKNTKIELFLSKDGKERILLALNQELHLYDEIDLTARETEHRAHWSWQVEYANEKGERTINASGKPESFFEKWEKPEPVFNSGTLYYTKINKDSTTILLKGGQVVDKSGKLHTLTINFEGPLKKIGELED